MKLKKYNSAAEYLIAANTFFKKGNKKGALKLMVKAAEDPDMDELVKALNEINDKLDELLKTADGTAVETDDEVVDDTVVDDEDVAEDDVDTGADDEDVVEDDVDDIEDVDVEEIVSSVKKKKALVARAMKSQPKFKAMSRLRNHIHACLNRGREERRPLRRRF